VRRFVPILLVPGLLLFVSQPVAAAAPPPAAVAAARARQAQLAQVRVQLGDTVASNLAAQEQLTQALAENRRQSQALSAQLADANSKVAAFDAEIAALDQRNAALEVQMKGERVQLDRLARALYVQPDSLFMALARAGSLADALSLVGDLQSASRRAQALQAQLERDQAQLAADRKKQADDRQQQASARDALQAKNDKLRQLNDQQQAALATLQDRLAATRAELASVNVQSSATAAYIAQSLEAEQAEASAAAYESVWEQVQLVGGSAAGPGPGHFANPLPGAVLTQPFGPSPYPFEPPYAGFAHFHTGIDVSTAEGTPVLAAAEGQVVLAGFNTGGYGNYVVIAHAGGLDTLYGHLDSFLVRQGQAVTAGQPIGTEGSTGNSTGAHLHFEVRKGGQPVDPSPYLAG
jgi:murein DD-endopeptidase MepM/ murein hydrolase activator NlpD